MKWLILAVGILFEVLGTICMKFSEGFTRLVPSVLVFLFYGICLVCLIFVLKKMDVSVAYTIWASAGIVLITLIGVLGFKEPISWIKVLSVALIIIGIVGLEYSE